MDQTIRCSCGKDFVFTEGEQKYFADRQLKTPRHCHACRIERRFQSAPAATDGYAANRRDREILGE
jgi:hypothetical protein